MASPTFDNILHADPGIQPSQSHASRNRTPTQPQHHPQPLPLPLPPPPPQQNQPPSATYDPASLTHYRRPSSSAASPAASGSSQAFSTPATSPAATLATSAANPAAQSTGHATNASLYQCAHCLKKYSRPEHLQRHIASHTLGKRFVCEVGLYFHPCSYL